MLIQPKTLKFLVGVKYLTQRGLTTMKQYQTEFIKNLALLGHASSGKTTVADAMIFAAGGTDRIGKTADGTTVMDYDA